MPNDPDPTPGGGSAAEQAPATVSGPPQRPIDVYAHIIQVLPEKESRFAQGAEIPLIVRVVMGVSSTAQTGFDFELSLTSERENAKAAFGSNKFSFPPGTFTTVSLEVAHLSASPGTYEINALVTAAPIGTGRFQYLTSVPEIGDGPWTYVVQ